MKTPGIGQRKKKFKALLGWGKKKQANGRKSNKQKIGKKRKLPRNIRPRRAKRNKRI